MAKVFIVTNPRDNVARERKPGIGTFEIGPGQSIELSDEKLARSLVNDSGGILTLVEKEVAEPKVKVESSGERKKNK